MIEIDLRTLKQGLKRVATLVVLVAVIVVVVVFVPFQKITDGFAAVGDARAENEGIQGARLSQVESEKAQPTPTLTPTPELVGETCTVCVPDGVPFPRSVRYLTLTCRFHDPKRPRHVGLDISVEEKMEVLATMDGAVIHAEYDDVYGNMVKINNGHYETWYAHNSYLLVRAGDYVHAGDTIALSGNTGASDGPHLHYEVREDGIPRNPQLYLGEESVRIATDKCLVNGGEEPCP